VPNHDEQAPELFDTSKVTDTPEHWAAFAERIAERAVQPPGSVEWLARSRAGWIGALAVLAASVVVLITSLSRERRNSTTDEWTRALVPEDSAARMVLLADGPPRLESLLLSVRNGR
jgi:hypothetical protein